jgi:hypothetical protein
MIRSVRGALRSVAFWLMAVDFPLLYYAGASAGDGVLPLVGLAALVGAALVALLAY